MLERTDDWSFRAEGPAEVVAALVGDLHALAEGRERAARARFEDPATLLGVGGLVGGVALAFFGWLMFQTHASFPVSRPIWWGTTWGLAVVLLGVGVGGFKRGQRLDRAFEEAWGEVPGFLPRRAQLAREVVEALPGGAALQVAVDLGAADRLERERSDVEGGEWVDRTSVRALELSASLADERRYELRVDREERVRWGRRPDGELKCKEIVAETRLRAQLRQPGPEDLRHELLSAARGALDLPAAAELAVSELEGEAVVLEVSLAGGWDQGFGEEPLAAALALARGLTRGLLSRS
ncbi:MAG: hypothetical protein AB7N76_31605 [Planctomycetota bacterium]